MGIFAMQNRTGRPVLRRSFSMSIAGEGTPLDYISLHLPHHHAFTQPWASPAAGAKKGGC